MFKLMNEFVSIVFFSQECDTLLWKKITKTYENKKSVKENKEIAEWSEKFQSRVTKYEDV